GHAVPLGELDKRLDLDRPLGERVGRMDPQMDEIGVGHNASRATRRLRDRSRRGDLTAKRIAACCGSRENIYPHVVGNTLGALCSPLLTWSPISWACL